MADLASLFDSYGRRARLYPVLLTMFPSVVTLIAWAPSVVRDHTISVLIGGAASSGLLYVLSSVSRTAGKQTEKRLLAQWGGWPTTIMLRHRFEGLPATTRHRYHQYLSGCSPWQRFPSPEMEEADPTQADEIYASAVQWLKEQRRAPVFKILHQENAEYGFRRNMRGLKPFALLLVLLTAAAWWVAVFAHFGSAPWRIAPSELAAVLAIPSAPAWAALGLTLVAFLGWIRMVRDCWVREAADQYAAALLATCDAPPQPDR